MSCPATVRLAPGWRPVALMLAALWFASPAAAQTSFDAGPAIDIAGRQRMLSQRIVKAYCQIGMDVTRQASQAQLDEAVTLFDTQLQALQRSAPRTPEVRRPLARTGSLWLTVRRMAKGKVSQPGAGGLDRRAEDLLRASHEVVLALEAAAGTPQSRLVNIAGRQRMLSQRLAKLYMMRSWGIDSPELRERTERAVSEFTGALAALRAAPENTPEIARELDSVALQWEWFSGAIKLQGAQSYALVVAEASESILASLELVTGLYAKR